MTYDLNGNITTLKRKGYYNSTDMQADDLFYEYEGNRLKAVDETGNATYGFKDQVRVPGFTEYNYDNNGNMIYDGNKSVSSITYNYLNLPEQITFVNNNKIKYLYAANGTKLKKEVYSGSTLTAKKNYCGEIVYSGNATTQTLEFIMTDEGRVLPQAGGSYKYEYFLKDHLGNTRVSFADYDNNGVPEVVQEDAFYPFGLQLGGLSWTSSTSGSTNKFLYNGKELQDDHGYNEYDYGMRHYMPDLGRFGVIDRFSEKYYSMSNYSYGANNPILMIDINGDSLWITHRTGFLGLGGKETLRYEDGSLYNKDGSAYTGKVKGFLGKSVNALNEASSGNEGNNMIDELQSNAQNVTVIKSSEGNSYEPGTNTVKFDPSSKNGGLNTRGQTERPTFIGLGHELAHGLDDVRGTLNLRRIPGQTFTYAEHFSTNMENKMRAENGLPLRTHYGINAAGSGVYPLIDASGKSLHYPGYNYYGALKMTPRRVLIPVTTVSPSIILK